MSKFLIILSFRLLDTIKIKYIIEVYSNTYKNKNKNNNLNEKTYVQIIELFIKNGFLNHASFFLCQMDRLKIPISRNLLDMFLDFSLTSKYFEKDPDVSTQFNRKMPNKFDITDFKEDPDYSYYQKTKTRYVERKDLNQIYQKLRLDAKPYIPKKISEQNSNEKSILSNIDPTKITEYIPKSYKVVKKEN